ncbi:hypothetical protein DENSPDRAFT_591008 [Dentipellis sp. KUC8613]|nr:hypothetical protein DENSPDRAFT_591008 [Dentipellis sp. KUC8613]
MYVCVYFWCAEGRGGALFLVGVPGTGRYFGTLGRIQHGAETRARGSVSVIAYTYLPSSPTLYDFIRSALSGCEQLPPRHSVANVHDTPQCIFIALPIHSPTAAYGALKQLSYWAISDTRTRMATRHWHDLVRALQLFGSSTTVPQRLPNPEDKSSPGSAATPTTHDIQVRANACTTIQDSTRASFLRIL